MLTPQQKWSLEQSVLSTLCSKTTATILSGPTTNTTLNAIRVTIPAGMVEAFNVLTTHCTTPLETLEKLVDHYERHAQQKPRRLSEKQIADAYRDLAKIKMNQWKSIIFEAFRMQFSETLINQDIDNLDQALKKLLVQTQKYLIKQRQEMLGHRAGMTTMMLPQTLSRLIDLPDDSQTQNFILFILTMALYLLMHHLGARKEIPMQQILDQLPTERIRELMQEASTKDAFIVRLNQMSNDLESNLAEINEGIVTFNNAYANSLTSVALNEMRPFFSAVRKMLPNYLIFSLPIFFLMIFTRITALDLMEFQPNTHPTARR